MTSGSQSLHALPERGEAPLPLHDWSRYLARLQYVRSHLKKFSMSIQWFPGHMNAARKKAAESMEKVDLVIEVLDARVPQASSNPMIEALRRARQRPCLKILNKSDLADPMATKQWLQHYGAQPQVSAVALSCRKPADVAKVPALCLKIAPHRGTVLKPLRVMIMGIPNVGKSTLMNALLKKRVAKVGDEPAVTKMQQRLFLGNNIVLIDTPGLMWPKIEHPTDGLMLAASHAIGVNAIIEEEVAAFLGELLLQHYAPLLTSRYGFKTEGMDGIGVVEAIAVRRSFRLKGGEVDIEKAAHTLLQDYRSGALGRISLETPASRVALLASYVPPPSLGEPQAQEELDEE
jgi:ribosome biogenesis GTPase A